MNHRGLWWVDTMLKASPADRKRLLNTTLDALSYYGSDWKKNGDYKLVAKNPKAVEFSSMLKSTNSDFEFWGFVPWLHYIKPKGPDMDSIFRHSWGSVTTFFRHKTLPMGIITGPSMRFNTSIIEEIGANENMYQNLEGATG